MRDSATWCRPRTSDGDQFRFEYSTDGGTSFTSLAMAGLPLADDDADRVGTLTTSGSQLIVRVVDTNHDAGAQSLDTVSIDELFVRAIH